MQKCSRCGYLNLDHALNCIACKDSLTASNNEVLVSGVHQRFSQTQEISRQDPDSLIKAGDQAWKSGQLEAAFTAYQRAFKQRPQDIDVLQSLLLVARKINDPVRLSRCLATLSQLLTDPFQKAEHLIEASMVSYKRRHEPRKAATGFLHALELDPDRLDAFLALTQIYSDLQSWTELEGAYQRMIQLHSAGDSQNIKLLAKLWRKLGVLLAHRLSRYEDAEIALNTAKQLDPNDLKNHATSCEIYRSWPARWREAVDALQHLIQREHKPELQADNLRMLAELYQNNNEHDALYCTLLALHHLNNFYELSPLPAAEQAFIAAHQRAMPKIPQSPLSPEHWRLLYPESFPHNISQIYALIALGVRPLLEQEPSDHGLRRRQKLDPTQPLLFNNLIRQISNLLGLSQPPVTYVKDEEIPPIGIIDGLLDPPGFIISRSLISGITPPHLTARVTRMIALQKQTLFMPGICNMEQLRGHMMGVIKLAQPNSPIPKNREMTKVHKSIKNHLSPQQHKTLLKLVNDMIDAGTEITLENYMVAAEDITNRLALLLSGDLGAVLTILNKTPGLAGTQNPKQRFERVLSFAVSPAFLTLRKLLGLTIQTTQSTLA